MPMVVKEVMEESMSVTPVMLSSPTVAPAFTGNTGEITG